MPGETLKTVNMTPIYVSYVAWFVLNLVLFFMSVFSVASSGNDNIKVNTDNLLSYYPGFWDAIDGKYNTYAGMDKFKEDTIRLKTLADPGKCDADGKTSWCNKNKPDVTSRMWYTYRFSTYYAQDHLDMRKDGNASVAIVPMYVHNDDKNASVKKLVWEDGIEGKRVYSPPECYELVRSYSHFFVGQTVMLSFFVAFHICILIGFYKGGLRLEKIIPVVFDASLVVYTFGFFYFLYLTTENVENQPHCAYLADWFGKGTGSMYSYVWGFVILYALGFLMALLTGIGYRYSSSYKELEDLEGQ